MPNFWAHRICASVTLEQLDAEVVQLLTNHEASYRLGSQGADLLYFRPTQFIRGKQGVVWHAKKLHSQPVENLAAMSLRFLEGTANKRHFESTLAYVCGFLCHHAVDQAVHPHIDARTSSLMRHRRIELDFDAFLCREMGVKPDRGSHHWAGVNGIAGFTGLAQWYNFMFNRLFDRKFSLRSYIRDYKAMRRLSGLLDRPKRLEKDKHVQRPVLSEPELYAMMESALQGAQQAAGLISNLYRRLETARMPQAGAVLAASVTSGTVI